jgi:hypothetical protein
LITTVLAWYREKFQSGVLASSPVLRKRSRIPRHPSAAGYKHAPPTAIWVCPALSRSPTSHGYAVSVCRLERCPTVIESPTNSMIFDGTLGTTVRAPGSRITPWKTASPRYEPATGR